MRPGAEQAVLLEVVCLHPRDAVPAAEGGADRLLLLADPMGVGCSPEPAAVSALLRESDLPVRVMLRLGEGLGVTGGELHRLAGLGSDYLSLGAAGVSFGFLDADLEIDRDACAALAAELDAPAWTFHHGFDAALETDRAWRDVAALALTTGLDAVASAGSTRGIVQGGDELVSRAAASPDVARLLLASGGLVPDQVPWLVRAGVRQFGIGATARPDRSWTKSSVDAGLVRSWRLLLDDALSRALGIPVD